MSLGEMCSFFYQAMETSTVQGDLSDVVLQAGGGGGGAGGGGCGFLPSTSDESAVDPVNKVFEELSAKAAPAAAAPLVSAPRAPGVKRRKGQAKRVICIPAPSTGDQESSSNKTHGGVVVPSDLWAWRKYGQKPIKGSPYPRGYYRCSSSKGCSARKQVERSRSDPNMLVITYTSDHNHPWPTHRNSLAGSTRSQPSKTTHNTSKNSSSTDSSHYNQLSPSSSKQEQEDMFLTSSSSPLEVIKEENLDPDRFFDESCKDMGFFDELGGLEPDPMSFFFSSSSRENKGLEPLSFFDWDGN